MNKETMGPY